MSVEYRGIVGETKPRTSRLHLSYRTAQNMLHDGNDYQPNLHTNTSNKKRRCILYTIAVIIGLFVVCTSVLLYEFGPMGDNMSSSSNMKLPHPLLRRSVINNPVFTPISDQAGEFLRDIRVADHCHLPDAPSLGMEDFYMKDKYTLEQVHVVLSSGETTPQQLHSDIPLADCQYKSDDTGLHDDFPAIVNGYIRANKAHSEFITHTISHERKCPPGQLSPLGMAKLKQLGRYLRDTYANLIRKGSKLHHPNKLIKVLSGQDSSSFHSTLSFLSSFLPHKDFHKVSVEKVTNQLCDKSQTDCQCPNTARSLSILMNNISTQDSKSQQHENMSFNKFFDNFQKNNLSAVEALGQLSPLICDKSLPSAGCHGNRCWNITRSHVFKLFQAVDKHTQNWMNMIPNREHSRLHVYPFITSLVKSFKNIHLSASPRIFVYTSTEEFMLQLLTAIENILDKFPRPGSRLVFELLSASQKQKKRYFLRVLFNGRDVTTNIPLCSHRKGDGICPLKYFVDYHSINFKNMFSKSNYTERCL
ncbi:2-phosphoxylose phosphatase 1-like [Ylistrum balloti]|uniref:2-phosphoxylose phosphatase 1-like n=1 Tax=Ylistrum balloti TaxID=509963 RepID=UPI0029058F90|nr:2-phosphoxylose phosphatase 1-like [Ylistrum balloti]